MKRILYKGLSLCMALSMLFSVSVSANEEYIFNIFLEYLKGDETPSNEELKETTVYIVGDSTSCEYGYDENYAIPRAGWGMYLSEFLNNKAKVVNLALAGRSSKSFATEENYKKLFDNIKEGDFLLIQFGHNDEKNKTEEDLKTRYTDPQGDVNTKGSFKNSLYMNYILPAQEKGAVPVLISPVSRRKFDKYGIVTDSHGLYDNAVMELAKEKDIYFIDMTYITESLYSNNLEINETKNLHAVYKDFSKGIDNTHYSHIGAKHIAMLFAAAVIQEESPLSEYILSPYVLSPNDFNKKIETMEYISKGNFISLLMRAAGIEGKSKDNFKDVDKNASYANAIGIAKESGIAFGDGKGNFKPEDRLCKYEAALFIMRTIRYLNFEYESFSKNNPSNYTGERYWMYRTIPEYANRDIADWMYLNNIYGGESLEYLCDTYMSELDAQHEVILFYELMAKNTQKTEQNTDDLEKVENTK